MDLNLEIEFKYRATLSCSEITQIVKNHVSTMVSQPDFYHVVSCDSYYEQEGVYSSAPYIRYRRGGSLTELTIKEKTNTDNNIVRKEINIDVRRNSNIEIVDFLQSIGFKKSFDIYKEAYIISSYKWEICHYTLQDDVQFIEIEAKNSASTDDAINTLEKWESRLGYTENDRITESLYELYKPSKL